MNWLGEVGNKVAVGARGIYTVKALSGGTFVLQGVGHDSLSTRALPWLGKAFRHLIDAQMYAQKLDAQSPNEAEVSGG